LFTYGRAKVLPSAKQTLMSRSEQAKAVRCSGPNVNLVV